MPVATATTPKMAARLTTESPARVAFHGEDTGDIGISTSGRRASTTSAAVGSRRTHHWAAHPSATGSLAARSDGTGAPEQTARTPGEDRDHQDERIAVLPF